MERTETITIDQNGNTTIRARFSGDREDFLPPAALPSENAGWKILENTVDKNTPDNDNKFAYTAEIEIQNGAPLPESFTDTPPHANSINLVFPTDVKMWTEGDRTFYEFSRTYQARDFLTFNLSESDFWDQKLEEKVFEEGIFNVSDEERESYLQQFGLGYGYQNLQFFSKTMGQLVRDGDILVSQRDMLNKQIYTYLEDAVRPVRLLGIMGQPEDSIGIAFSALETEIHDYMMKMFYKAVGENKPELREKAERILSRLRSEYTLTQTLDNNSFSITVYMPGQIIQSNGLVDFDEMNKVEWQFTGKHLHDCHKPLYALSVLEKTKQ